MSIVPIPLSFMSSSLFIAFCCAQLLFSQAFHLSIVLCLSLVCVYVFRTCSIDSVQWIALCYTSSVGFVCFDVAYFLFFMHIFLITMSNAQHNADTFMLMVILWLVMAFYIAAGGDFCSCLTHANTQLYCNFTCFIDLQFSPTFLSPVFFNKHTHTHTQTHTHMIL